LKIANLLCIFTNWPAALDFFQYVMKLLAKPSTFFLIFFLMTFSCRKVFDPPAIKASNHFLAVDGFIQTGSNVSTTITVSRSLNLNDSVPNIPELNAQVSIQSSNGNSYSLFDGSGNGIYGSPALNLDSSLKYQLAITTNDGNKYISDLVTPKSAPPIDSITWELVNDPLTLQQAVNVYVNSHDANNNTHYYRWDYLETFKHLSALETAWGEANGLIYPLDVLYSTHSCWSTVHSANILLGSSIALSQDVISHALIANYQQNDPKMDIGNSILVRQYPLTPEAYNYWLTVQKNSQSLGGLFDLQPSQITGNLHCTTNPGSPILGFVSASSVQEQRVYISNHSLPGWKSNPLYSCVEYNVPLDQLNLLIYNYPDTSYGPYHFSGDLIISLVVAPKSCMDCRYQGGVNIKPSFWPPID
jgi:Domain of unknown function (DUF4249)